MNLILFLTAIVVSFIVVRIGAIAFQLTGLEWSLAKFQALSCFTSTGFTTKEAELITGSLQRRRIASILMVLGHAGLVTMIATFANSLRAPTIVDKSVIPFIPNIALPWINLGTIGAAIYILYRIITNTKLVQKITNYLRKSITKKKLIKRVSFEELAIATGGYGVAKIKICQDSPVLDKTLSESGLRNQDITVLAIIRDNKTEPNPASTRKILLGDDLICFGNLDNIKSTIGATDEQ